MTPEYFAHLISVYGYIVIFPFAIIEGPILTVIGGFLASIGLLNPFLLYIVVLAGDAAGDTLCYALGRWGQPLARRYGRFIGLTEKRLESAREYFTDRHTRALVASKLIHGIGMSGLVAAGMLHVPYLRFIRTCMSVSALQSLVLLAVGYCIGSAYKTIGAYLDYFAAGMSIVVLFGIVAFIFFRLRRKTK